VHGHTPATAVSPAPQPIPPPQDQAYPGQITLEVDASDYAHRVIHVVEHISGLRPGAVLFYPKWLPGNHSPTGPIERLAGLQIRYRGVPLAWERDPLDVYAFHLKGLMAATPGAADPGIELRFDYLAPTTPKVARIEFTRELLVLDWNTLLLYPAGYAARRIPVQASLRLAPQWSLGSALEREDGTGPAAGASGDAATRFRGTDLETLVDSPVYAGRHGTRFNLAPEASVPVHMDLFADRPELLAMRPEQLAQHRALVDQALRLFGARHFHHYDFLYALSDQLTEKGLEHHQSSEDTSDPDTFTDWDKTSYDRELLAHEFTHSWNGKFRRPADLRTPSYNVPMQNSLLWVYEGQTQYWGKVLTARAGLWTRQQSLDDLAMAAASVEHRAGRAWRPLQDTTQEPIINYRQPQPWIDYQRQRDYYDEGMLIWLDVDTLLRERSQGKRSLDDFARAFFGLDDGSLAVKTYTFADVVEALRALQPLDWASFLRQRLDGVGRPAPLDGLQRGGYTLVYTDTPSALQKDAEAKTHHTDLMYSLGLAIDDKESRLEQVAWDGPAFRAGLMEGAQLLSVNGVAYNADILREAITAARGSAQPIELIVRSADRYLVARIDYHDGLRYPHLQRDEAVPALLDAILAPRQP